jgi:hypothetical protein
LQASAAGGYGSFNSRKFNGLINHKAGAVRLFDFGVTTWRRTTTSRSSTTTEPPGIRTTTATEKRNNAQVEQANVLAKAGYDASETLRLDLMNQFFTKDQGIPSWNNSPT